MLQGTTFEEGRGFVLKVDDLAAPHTLQTLAILGTQPEVNFNIKYHHCIN